MAKEYDLIVLGAGSGNMVLPKGTAEQRIAIIEPSRFGGTCLNRGCIPSKMFVVAADTAQTAREAGRLGVNATFESVDWPAIRDRVFGRIDPIHEDAISYRESQGIDVYREEAVFTGKRTVKVGNFTLTAKKILISTGSRPFIPPIKGLEDVDYLTSDDVMRMETLPKSMVVIGGGFIAAEMGHVFTSFGVDVTIIQSRPVLIPAEDTAIAERFTNLAQQRMTVRLASNATAVKKKGTQVCVTVEGPDGTSEITAEVLLLAAGRQPNTDLIDVEAGGLELDEHGHLVYDEYGRTTSAGVWALGDASNHFQLKHMANAEARVIEHNLHHPRDLKKLPQGPAPHAVFGEPQVASIGMTERDAHDEGVDHVVATREYSKIAYGWAMEDTTSFVKLIADPNTRLLLGAHILGPEAAILIQPLIQAMMLGNTVDQLANDVIYIHPAMTEVVEQALLEL